MRISSARQLELDYSGTTDAAPGNAGNASGSVPGSTPGVDASSAPIASLRMPNFGIHGEVYAATSRMAGRINAASVSQDELDKLLRERQTLLDKRFDGTITRQELNRLQYVRWSLDRIEDAKTGYVLDALENWVSRYETFLSEMRGLEGQLNQILEKRK